MHKFLLAFLALLAYIRAMAQVESTAENFPPPLIPPVVYAIETKESMIVDGKLNEDIWKNAPVIQDFFRMEPRQGGKYLYKTFVQIVFDSKNLYVGVFCKDSIGKKGVKVQDLRRDFIYGENDIFFLQLDPQNLKRFCVSFQTTPYGNQRDLQVFDGTLRDNDWDALWKVKTTIAGSGYYAEFAIPFKSLRYENRKNTDSLSWGITLARLARRDFEQTVFPSIPQAFDMYRMTYAAQLKGLKLPPSSANVRVQPYTLFQADKSTSNSGQKSNTNTFKIGGEIKWAINPSSVIDITFNTDFAQADVDRAVNNLTRFNVFFPERRQFFLENSGIYSGADISNVKPFFSRTIGLANAQFNANPVPIDAGIRYTERNQKRTIAGLYVHQQCTDKQGRSNFGVLRYARNYGQQNNIGMMLTHRLDEADIKKGFLQRNNTTLTIDGFIRPNDDVTIQYLATASRDNTNDSIGVAGNFSINWTPNTLFLGWLTDMVGEKYVPGMGFVFANNTMRHNPGGYYIWRPKGKLGKIIRRWEPGAFIDYYQNADNLKFQSAIMDIFPVYITFNDNSLLDITWHPTWESFFFSPLGFDVSPGHYFFNRYEIGYKTDASKKISADVNFYGGPYYDGALDTWTALLRIAPSPKIAFTGEFELNRVRDLGIAKVNEDIGLFTGGVRLAANPRLQLSAFYQYNDFDQRGRWNVRGSWEFAPLSFLYLVFNESNFRASPVKNQNVISKLTYLKQF
jgi:Domain of unknown function (DUF5916)